MTRAQRMAVVGLVLGMLGAVLSSVVRADPVYWCGTAGVVDGDPWEACPAHSVVESSTIMSGFVDTCVSSSAVPGGYIGDCDGTWIWRDVTAFQAGDLVADFDSGLIQEPSWFSFAVDGEPPPDDGDDGGDATPGEFDISDLDEAKLAGFFSVGFILLFNFWLIGKGIGLILGVLKRA